MTKDTFWFKHDYDAADDEKTMILIEQLGLEGYGIYWVLIEKLRAREGYKMPFSIVPSLARRYMTTPEKMKTVIMNYGLFQYDDEGFFYSESLIIRMQALIELKNKRSAAGRLGNVKRWKENKIEQKNDFIVANSSQCDGNAMANSSQCDNNAMAKRTQCDGNAIASCRDKNRIDNNIEEYKDNNKENNKDNNNNAIKPLRACAKGNWRKDYEVYKSIVNEAKVKILEDKTFEESFLSMYPNGDFYRTIVSNCNFWLSDKGWECKKKSKGEDINMVSTIKKNHEKNVIYKNPNDEPIENLKKLNIETVDGKCADGTFIKGAYRYYHSLKDNRDYSIPIQAPPMLNERCEFDIKTNSWYIPRENEQIEDFFW